MSAPDPLRQSRASGLPIDEQGYCYLDEKHFDQILNKIAMKLACEHRPTMARMIGLPMLTWGLFGVLCFAFMYAGWHNWTFILYFLLAVAGVVQGTNVRRVTARIVQDQMCFGCGYQLIGARVDADGWGKCPECARGFNLAEYRRPPRDYQSILWHPQPQKVGYPSIDTGLDWLHTDDEARLRSRPVNEPQMNADQSNICVHPR